MCDLEGIGVSSIFRLIHSDKKPSVPGSKAVGSVFVYYDGECEIYPHTLGGVSYILNLYINSPKEVVSHLEVELYKTRRYISLTTDSDRCWVWL